MMPNRQILSAENVRALAENLPDTVSSSDWVNLFSDARHGTSLETLLARCAGWEPTLVVIEAISTTIASADSAATMQDLDGEGNRGRIRMDARAEYEKEEGQEDVTQATVDVGVVKTSSGTLPGDAAADARGCTTTTTGSSHCSAGVFAETQRKGAKKTAVFGGFASGSQWRNMGKGFAGDGRSFLFSFDKLGNAAVDSRAGGGGGVGRAGGSGSLRTYQWSGSDRYFMTADSGSGMGMGGGGQTGDFGFFLEKDFRRGSTGSCETFSNEPLISSVCCDPLEAAGDGGEGALKGELFEVTAIEVWGFRNAVPREKSTRTIL